MTNENYRGHSYYGKKEKKGSFILEELTPEKIELARRCVRRLAENPEEILDILGINNDMQELCNSGRNIQHDPSLQPT